MAMDLYDHMHSLLTTTTTYFQLSIFSVPGFAMMMPSDFDDWADWAFSASSVAATDGDDEEWDQVFQEEQTVCQQESQEVEAACELQSESSEDSAAESDESRSIRVTSWWARQLFSCIQEMGRKILWPSKPIEIVSACSGCCPEAAVCKAQSWS